MRSRFLLPLLTALFALSACAPLTVETPPPAPQAIRVAYSPTLRPWADALHACAGQTPEMALVTEEVSPAAPDFEEADLTLWFGEPPQGFAGAAFSLGVDEIVIITGADLNFSPVTPAQLQEIYTGAASGLQPWTYPEGSDLRSIFDEAVLAGASPSPDVMLAPSPAAMLEAVAADPQAVGYVPKSWLAADVQTAASDSALREMLAQPVLALTAAEPQGTLRDFLACLQKK